MKVLKYIILLLLFSGLVLTTEAQKNHIRLAEKRFDNHNYFGAAKAWQKAFGKTESITQKRQLAFKIGQAYHLMNQFAAASQWYADAIGESTVYPEWYIAYADALLRNGNIEEALAAAKNASRLDQRSAKAQDIELLIKRLKQQKFAENITLHQAFGINSQAIDYSPSWMNNDLIFASTRRSKLTAQVDGRTAQGFSSLFRAKSDPSGDYTEPMPLEVRGNHNAGTFSWDANRQRAFWTKCNNRKQKCLIMEANYNAQNDKWDRPKVADFVQKKYHFGHPFVSEDGRWLYFVSDTPGGYGGKDIYKVSIKDDGSWGIPINLGQPVNTARDELFPTKAGDSLLFFSSGGHQGYGGLDILYSFNKSGDYAQVGLLGYPYNSFADDFGLLLQTGEMGGALVSNKSGENSDDIYLFDEYPVRLLLEVEVLLAESREPLSGAELIFKMPAEAAYNTLSNSNGHAQVSVPAYGQGKVEVNADGYFPEIKTYTITDEAMAQGVIRIVFLLKKSTHYAAISGLVTERETAAILPGETVTISGPGGYQAQSLTNAQGVYTFNQIVPDNIFTIKVSKQGYFTETRTIRIPEISESTVFNKAAGYDMDFQLLQIQEKREIVINEIYYDFDKATLRESSKYELNKLVSMLRETPQVRVQISAHTDTRGTHNYNDRLSEARAKSVTDYLIANGISRNRLISKGYGKRFPVITNARNEDEHQANRRTTFQVTGVDYVEAAVSPFTQPVNSKLVYRIQLMASSSRHDPENYFSALKNLIGNLRFFVQEQAGMFRYEAGDRYNLFEAETLRNQIRAAGFDDCFIVPYYDNKRISMQEAKQIQP
jgi:outer membrane protein OmpA-like peptidoglycan-associated protein/tetratricopeptide (TPR) repeat protein